MPVYEYHCTTCKRTFSRLARRVMSDADALPTCPDCGSTAERALSSFAYHRSLQMQIDNIDPQIERELDAADSMKDDPIARMGL